MPSQTGILPTLRGKVNGSKHKQGGGKDMVSKAIDYQSILGYPY